MQLLSNGFFSCSAFVKQPSMIGLGLNSLGNHNNPLSWSLIPNSTKGELTYTGTCMELQKLAMLSFDICTCSDPECWFCEVYDKLIDEVHVKCYEQSDICKEGRLSVETAPLKVVNVTTFWDGAISLELFSAWTSNCFRQSTARAKRLGSSQPTKPAKHQDVEPQSGRCTSRLRAPS